MNLKTFKKELLQDPGFKKEYYNSDDWAFRISLMVKKERIKKGLTQKQLAKLVGTKQPGIARLESGINVSPRLDFLNKIAKALDINLALPKFTEYSISGIGTYEINLEELWQNEKQIEIEQFIFSTNKKASSTRTSQFVLTSQ